MKKVVFLDRDGTINVDKGYVFRQDDWQFAPRAVEALQALQETGFTLAVITNQSGVTLGYYTAADMRALHDYMLATLEKEGVHIAAVAFCPHGRDSTCDCRKPQPGMAKHVEEQIGAIDYARSWTVGDKTADLMFGKNVGTKTALIRSQYWQEEDLTVEPDVVVDSLYDAVDAIVRTA